MDPLQQQQISMATVNVYLSIEEQMLVNIAKQLKKHKSLLTEEDILSWQTKQLSMIGTLTQQNIITIAKHSGYAVDEVSKALETAGYGTVQEFEGTLQEAVQLGLLVQQPNSIIQSTVLESILASYQSQTLNTLNMVNTTMLNQSQQAYLDIINNTVGKVLAGVQTPYEALRSNIKQWADSGIPALIDKGGKQWSTESYVSMVTRSTVNNVANEMQLQRAQEYGCDLIEVSSHMGARPKCSLVQGRIFSLSGNHPKYPAWSSTSYGEPDGILGINCHHVVNSFIEGISKQTYKPVDADKNSKSYQESQQQRKLERDIRKAKRELSMMEALDDTDGIKQAKSKIRQKQSNMREFIDSTNRSRNRQREQIYG